MRGRSGKGISKNLKNSESATAKILIICPQGLCFKSCVLQKSKQEFILFPLGKLMKIERLANQYTLKCLSIGTPKTINFPFVSDEKLMFLVSQYSSTLY